MFSKRVVVNIQGYIRLHNSRKVRVGETEPTLVGYGGACQGEGNWRDWNVTLTRDLLWRPSLSASGLLLSYWAVLNVVILAAARPAYVSFAGFLTASVTDSVLHRTVTHKVICLGMSSARRKTRRRSMSLTPLHTLQT